MKVLHWSFDFTVLLVLMLFEESNYVDGQTLISPFVYVCRRSCGGFGMFRRMCCYFDETCCTKPDECPADPAQDVLLPMCRSCTNDVDCMFTAKCCDHDGRKCCTPIRSGFRKYMSQRAKNRFGTFRRNTTRVIEEDTDEDLA